MKESESESFSMCTETMTESKALGKENTRQMTKTIVTTANDERKNIVRQIKVMENGYARHHCKQFLYFIVTFMNEEKNIKRTEKVNKNKK